MKKNFKYILLIVFMMFIGTPFVKAETLDCNYLFSPTGSYKDEKNNVKANLKIDTSKKTISLNGVKLINIEDKNINSVTISSKVKVGNYYFVLGEELKYFLNEENSKCPVLTYEVDRVKSSDKIKYKDNEANVIKVYDSNSASDDYGNYRPLSKASLLDKNNELNNCPTIDGAKSTYYSVEKAASDLLGDYKYQRVINIGVCAYNTNHYYIIVNGDARIAEYVGSTPDANGYLWDRTVNLSGFPVRFVIRSSEWGEINKSFPYMKNVTNSNNKKNLRFTKIKDASLPIFVMSINEIQGGVGSSTSADSDYDPNDDPLFGDLLSDPSISQKISDRVGVCTDYLGSASDDGSVANLIDEIFDIAKVVSIILVIVLTMVEVVSAITKDKDELPNIIKKTVKRLIVLLIILLLPTFIDMVGNIIGIEDILCGIK